MNTHYRWFVFVVVLSVAALWLNMPGAREIPVDLNSDGQNDVIPEQPLGLDLIGGLRVLLQAEIPPTAYDASDLRETANNVLRRVNGLGLTEATVQVQGNARILVEIPGVTDPQQAIDTIQQTALLEFVDFGGLSFTAVQNLVGQRILTDEQEIILQARRDSGQPTDGFPTIVHPQTGLPFDTVMTGASLQAAAAQLQNGEWVISFALTPEGTSVFGPFTATRVGEALAIVLDGAVLSAPTIESPLTDGGIITGQFTEEEARTLALQLRSGSLRIPLRVENAVTVGATLGQESVSLSVRAGIIGVIVVLTFMLVYYRVPGIAAAIALLVFILLNLTVFKLLPVTLTLPAITGFLISIGTAVDGNILIFERVKEELRGGKTLDTALAAGFDRAWSSIRDSNFSTILICGVLFLFGQTPGASIVSGFAVTLAAGLIINLFTAILVTRTFLYLLVQLLQQPLTSRRWLLGA